ncbi:hypothetical protein, partial [Vibrio vulnificus]|uniref:hypothetical protein n=1 Tax=Vibrio vulnificus TaxID=672 RepID=UPI001F1FCE18
FCIDGVWFGLRAIWCDRGCGISPDYMRSTSVVTNSKQSIGEKFVRIRIYFLVYCWFGFVGVWNCKVAKCTFNAQSVKV